MNTHTGGFGCLCADNDFLLGHKAKKTLCFGHSPALKECCHYTYLSQSGTEQLKKMRVCPVFVCACVCEACLCACRVIDDA